MALSKDRCDARGTQVLAFYDGVEDAKILAVATVDANGDVVDPSGTTGGATEAKQDTAITALADLLTELQGKADLAETQPVSAATLPLPAGAATAANQGTANAALSEIEGAVEALEAALSSIATDKLRASVVDALPAGANNIGDVDVASTPAVEASYQTGEEAGATLGSNGTTWTELCNAGGSSLKIVEVFNHTDGVLEVSFDGGTTVHARLPSGGSLSRDLKALELVETGVVSVREWASEQITTGYAIVNTAY